MAAAKLFQELHQAITSNFLPSVLSLLARGASAHLNEQPEECKRYSLPLEKAVTLGHVEVTRALLEHGADTGLDFRMPLLQRAIKSKNAREMLRLLVAHGVEVNRPSTRHMPSALHEAVVGPTCKAGVLELLFEHGADVNLVISEEPHADLTPLMVAARDRHNPKAVQALLEHGARVNAHWKHGTALHAAVENPTTYRLVRNKRQLNTVRLLLEHGADVNFGAGTPSGTALHAAVGRGRRDGVKVCRMLLDAGADVNAVDHLGRTVLHYAVVKCTSAVVSLLVGRGADMDAVDHEGKTALIMCTAKIELAMHVDMLINRGAALNVQDGDGNTALHKAATRGWSSGAATPDERMCRLLLRTGADPFIRNHAGKTVVDVCHTSDLQVKQVLQEAADKARLATLLLGLRVGAPGGQPNSLTRLGQHDLFDPNVLGVVADALTGCGSMRVTRGAAASSSSSSSSSAAAASSSSSSSSHPTKRARLG